MSKLVFKTWISVFILISCFVNLSAANADENTFGYRIFEIQKKHALKGSTLAQYKLGTFYEFGISVKSNPQEASTWYKKAAKKNNKPAANRLRYLDIKINGYQQSTHSQWVEKIKGEAQRGNVHSIIILGQLNHYGLGVKKDLKKALALLRKASANGHTEIDFEIDLILKQTEKKAATQSAPPSAPVVTLAPKAEPKKKTTPKKQSKPVTKTKKHRKNNKTKAEKELIKRRKYEKAMRMQYREQLLLEQQQQWSEGEDWSDEEGEGEAEADE